MMTDKPPLRFAFDLGTNSIGWAVYKLDRLPAKNEPPATVIELVGCGVRLFDDGRNPKDGRSLAEMRRGPRSFRRRRDRYLMRRANLMASLVELGFMPRGEAERRKLVELDPYELRARGLDQPLTPYELGRALFHLNQRRGFKSNRRADRKGDDKEKGKIAEGAKKLREALEKENARTFGEYLWRRHGGLDGKATPRTRQGVRIRLEGEGARALYDYYPVRQMLADEFDQLTAAQRPHHPALLTELAIGELSHVIFRQRPLKPVEKGRCTLIPDDPEERRLSKALPSVEERTIYETLNHLRYGQGVSRDTTLTREQRDLIAGWLMQGKTKTSVGFDAVRKALRLDSSWIFKPEDSGKTDLHDVSSKSAWRLGGKEMFGPRWHTLPLDKRDAIVQRLIDEDEEDKVVAWLAADYGLEEEAARAVAGWMPPVGVARLGKTANAAVLAELRDGLDERGFPIVYSEAVKRAGEKRGEPWHHSDYRDGAIDLPLPYYGRVLERHVSFGSGNPEHKDEKRYGRLPNPTVHIGLGQLRRLVNKLVKAYGEPAQIVIELARDLKLSKDQKDEERKKNDANRKKNDERRKILAENNQPDTGENLLRLRLFEEQERANGGVALCPYSLKSFGIEKLFSPEIEIDHILPYSRTLDDTAANRILCYREANRNKRRQTPHEAFSRHANWDGIVAAAAGLPSNKRWRFATDAMERYQNKERDFLARQINETRHLSVMARLYLSKACDPDYVYVTTGQLTAMLRGKWGLNSVLRSHNQETIKGEKNRDDHRHHAIDAITIGAIDRSLLQEMAKRAGHAEERRDARITADVPDPFPGFRDAAREKVNAVVVSIKPEHGKGGALHEDTAYGLVKNPAEAAEIGNLVFRKPLADLSLKEIGNVRDPMLRKLLRAVAAPFLNGKAKKEDKTALSAALQTFARVHGVRRVRICKKEEGFVPIRDRRTGAAYKALIPGENHHIDIVQMRDGSWKGFAATVFDVNQKDWRPVWERDKLGGKLVMRVHKGDMIAVDDTDGQRRIKTVHQLWKDGRLLLAVHNEGGKLDDRDKSDVDTFKWDRANIGKLKSRNSQKLRVNEIGQVSAVKSNVER